MGVKSHLIGCEDGPFRHVRACWGWGNLLYYKGPLCLLLCLLCSQKFWPLFCEESLLQEVKPGVQCPTEDQEWHRREQRDIGGEGQCQERHGSTGRYGSCSSHLLFTLNSMCFVFFFVLVLTLLLLYLDGMTSLLSLHWVGSFLCRAPRRVWACSKCVSSQCLLGCTLRVTWLQAKSRAAAYVSLIIQLKIM